jgi:TRAP-type C4-dicarboxylate transport system permease small subunit
VTRGPLSLDASRSRARPKALVYAARFYAACLDGLRRAANLALVALVTVGLISVVVRYVGIFPGSLHWATEFSRFAIIWIVMLGSVLALHEGAHMAIDVVDLLPRRWRRAVRAAGYLMGVAFLGALAWQGFKLSQATMRQISPALGLPMGYAYLAIPVGATLMTLQSILLAIMPDVLSASDESSGAAPDSTF